MRLVCYWLPVFIWVGVVAYLSSLPHIFVTEIPYLVPVLQKMVDVLIRLPYAAQVVNILLGVDLSTINLNNSETLRAANFLFRKGMHVLVYLVLGFLTIRALINTIRRAPILLTILFVTAVAAADEYHQTFNPARAARVMDVGLDVSGGIIGIGVYLVLRWFLLKLRMR
jgi:VanZ family protein